MKERSRVKEPNQKPLVHSPYSGARRDLRKPVPGSLEGKTLVEAKVG